MTPVLLPPEVEFIIERLQSSGHTAYVVGGAVRDHILSRPIGDYDITTSATPDEIKVAFSDCRTLDTGIKHGTVSVVLSGRAYEITTYRIDGDYLDNRHPDKVIFTDRLSDDLARRDLTVNAVAYNPTHGYVDLFGGVADGEARIIRAVGEPARRFDEDALRILRALRFASVLDFEIEKNTSRALRERCDRLSDVSRERVFVEMMKLICGDGAYRIIGEYSEVILSVIPTLDRILLPDAERANNVDGFSLFLSIFALSAKDPVAAYSGAMHSLRSDNARRILGISILSNITGRNIDTDADLLRLLSDTNEEVAFGVIKLRILLGTAEGSDLDRLKALLASGRAYKLKHLALRGNDIMALGISGERVGQTLELLLDAVIDGAVENTHDALVDYARRLFQT